MREVFAPGRLLVRESGTARDQAGRPSPRPSPAGRGGSAEPSPPGGGRGQGEGGDLVPFLENGLRFLADLASGQKTGFFLDQRDNRSRLRALARGRSVLNLFSYSGAFSVAALAGGAARAVDVDSSAGALALARANRRANGLGADEADFVEADVFDDLRRRVDARERWDARRLRSAGLRQEARGRRPRRARLQGHQPAGDGPRRSGWLAPDLLLLGPRGRRPLPEDRVLGERRLPDGVCPRRDDRAPGPTIRSRSTVRKVNT